jgi:predicted AlkP superfamily pyrophosphatase or phosphodiesterase
MHNLFVMSVDALFTDNLADVRHLPGFAEILGRAAIYEDVYCVYPTLTYVCHASIMSGFWPERHGVPHNQILDPATQDRAWYWDYTSLHVPTVFDWAHLAKLTTASVGWPVTAGAGSIDHNVPEVWVADPALFASPASLGPALDEVYRHGCSPSGWELYEAHRGLLDNNRTPALDEFDTACNVDLIERYRPNVLFTHQATLDHARHAHGVLAPEVQEALRLHDGWLQQCIAALKRAGTYDDTVFVILGDHGHVRVDYKLSPNVLLARAGLIDVAEDGSVLGWRAYLQSSGVSGQLYARDEKDCPAARDALQPLIDQGLISDVLTYEDVREQFHGTGTFAFMVEAAPNYGIGSDCAGELVTPAGSDDYRYAVSTHGHLPFRGDKPPFIVAGPGVVPGRYAGARLIDEAPTMMSLAGIPFNAALLDGEDLAAAGSRAVSLPNDW